MTMATVAKYDMFELEMEAGIWSGQTGKERALLEDIAVFWRVEDGVEQERVAVSAFRKNRDYYAARFLPMCEGEWRYEIRTPGETVRGGFLCEKARDGVHGPVTTDGDRFRYADGARYIPFGTTCYAWTHQKKELQEETLETLKHSCFNKIRMLVFPKFMPYNQEDPEVFPFEQREDGSWDVTATMDAYWENLDLRIARLGELGVEADLILFHPYDRWGFAHLTQEDSLFYVKYMIARYAAYRNLWWSLANEYEMLYDKSMDDWDAYGELLAKKDPYHHLISVHDILNPYPKRDWMTHASIQSGDVHRVGLWRERYGLPVIDDEFGYEGNLEFDWGNLSAFDFVDRLWTVVCRGGFGTHGETFHRDDEVLWWGKGGKLYGQSERRMAFLKDLLYSLPGEGHGFIAKNRDPNQEQEDGGARPEDLAFGRLLERTPEENKGGLISMQPMLLAAKDWRLRYFGRTCPYIMRDELPEGIWKAEIINVWEMTRETLADGLSGKVGLRLPAKPGMAVLLTRM